MAAIKATQRQDTGGWDRNGRNTSGPYDGVPSSVMQERMEEKKGIDPFASWTSDSVPQMSGREAGTFKPEKRKKGKGEKKGNDRRRVVAMLATGVIAAGIVGVGGIEITHFLHTQQSGEGHATPLTQPMSAQGNTAPSKQNAKGKQPKAMTQAKQTPAQPTKKVQLPTPGVVVGMTTQAPNSAKDFKNPTDGNDSLLVRLPDGTFTAYERACTHQQVPVNYNTTTKKFVCPLHGSIFDPAQNGKVLQGPASAPLPAVKVSVNADGTVTAV